MSDDIIVTSSWCRARFEDATFFYASDTLRQLSSFREQLKGITFHERLGSMHAKTERVEGMLPTLMEALKLSEDDKGCALAAAPLAMADLGTSVVTEFTNLAGVMGKHYAEREGQPAEVGGDGMGMSRSHSEPGSGSG